MVGRISTTSAWTSSTTATNYCGHPATTKLKSAPGPPDDKQWVEDYNFDRESSDDFQPLRFVFTAGGYRNIEKIKNGKKETSVETEHMLKANRLEIAEDSADSVYNSSN